MASEESAELHAKLNELKSETEVIAFTGEVARKFGKDDQLVLNLGEHAAVLVGLLDKGRAP